MTKQKATLPSYISNHPQGADLFEGKSHERIAKSIASHIQKNGTFGIVGLEGEWGSGKSNIIEILKKELKESHYIYVYDAWGHQEDSHRRAFLEELTEELIVEEIIDKKTTHTNIAGKEEQIKWKEKLKFLLSKKRKTQTQTVPEIGSGIIIIALVLLLTPLLTIISDIIFDENTIWWKKILLPIFPLSVSIIIYLISSFVNKAFIRISDLFFLAKGQTLKNTTLEVFSDATPSVKEFKDWINSVSKSLNRNRDLVIVFDNMDRLPQDKVKALWSSIHTFFSSEKYDKVHTIIPFDREHLKKTLDDKIEITNEFINKSFSITYRVSPPVLSDWKYFFKSKFDEAFNSEAVDFSIAMTVFNRIKERFTPRDIIVYINDLVSYKTIWKDEIPLKYIAIFVLKKDEILKAPQKSILNNSYLGSAGHLFVDDDDLQKYMATLTFNIPKDKSEQVLMMRELELALQKKSEIAINDFTKNKNFIEVLESVELKGMDIESAVSVLAQLDRGKVKGEKTTQRISRIWDEITLLLCNLQINNVEFQENHKSLLLNASNASKLKFTKHYINDLRVKTEIKGCDYYNALNGLDRFISENKFDINLKELITEKKVEPDVFMDYLIAAEDNYKKYKLATDKKAFDIHLSEMIKENIRNIPNDLDLTVLKNDYSLRITEQEIEHIISQNLIEAENFDLILKFYKSIVKKKPLTEKISIDKLYNLLQAVDESHEGYNDLIALRLVYANAFNQRLQNRRWQDNTIAIINETDLKFVKTVASVIEFYENYGELLSTAINWNVPLLNAVCKELTLNDYGSSKMNIRKVLPDFEAIIERIGVSAKEMLENLNGWNQYLKLTTRSLTEIIPDYTFFEYTCKYSLDITRDITELVKKYIKESEKETLLSEWGKDDSYRYNALFILMENNKLKVLPRNVFNAIKEVFKKIAINEIQIPGDETIWPYFAKKADKRDIAPTIRDIKSDFVRDRNISPDLFLYFENFFQKYGQFESDKGNVTRAILTRVISDDACRENIIANQTYYIPIIKGANEDAANFKETIYSLLKAKSEDTTLKSFAKKIGMELSDEEA